MLYITAILGLEGVFFYASFDGQLQFVPGCGTDTDSGPERKWIWVAKDEEAFPTLQTLCAGPVSEPPAVAQRPEDRILPLGDGTRIRLKGWFYFDGSRLRSGQPPAATDTSKIVTVMKVEIRSGYAEGQTVFVPASYGSFPKYI